MCRCPVALAAALAVGCSEYAVIPAPGPINEPGAADFPTVHAPSWSPLAPAPTCDGVDLAESGPTAIGTCDAVAFASWDLANEWETPFEATAFATVLPDATGQPDILVGRMGSGIDVLDGRSGTERTSFSLEGYGSPYALSVARDPSRLLTAAWHDPTRGGLGEYPIRSWSETGAETVSVGAPAEAGGMVRWLDIDADGIPELLGHNLSVQADGTSVAYVPGSISYISAMTANGDFNGDGRVEIASTHGIWDALTGAVTPWSGLSESTFQAAPVLIDGEVAFLGTDGLAAFRARPDGEVVWRVAVPENDQGIAVGDVDGDGAPELAVNTTGEVILLDANGTQLWSVTSRQVEAGSVVMADLDADGAYEVIAYGNSGLRILSGRDGTILAADSTIYNSMSYGSPAVADIDGDGSAEIVVVGRRREDDVWVVRAYGAAEGRWARTRPVWNELDYDVTTVQDDGKLAVWPIPSWGSYNSFRAQPAHDGAHPDLTVTATDLCCDSDTVYLAVQPSNQGSVDALSGATITLSTNDGTGWRAVASQVLADGIGAQRSLAGLVFEIPRSDWGNLQILQITGTDGDECDFVNDRVQVELECPEP